MTAYDPVILKSELTRDEGRKNVLYLDSRGIKTCFIGHNMAIPQSDFVIDAVYACDVAGCEASLDLHWPWWRQLDPVRQRVMMNLMFNMGSATLSEFVNTLAAIKAGNWVAAAAGMKNSAWNNQVGARAVRLEQMMLTGATT